MITYDDRQLMIEKYKDILRVRKNEIKIQCAHYTLTIQGSDLMISALTRDEILIGGTIATVVFNNE